jgi:hypothetical protein
MNDARAGGEEIPPRLADVCPDLVEDIVSLLQVTSPGDPLAGSMADLPFHGIHRGYVLTAPEGAPTSHVVYLGRGEDALFLLGLDPSLSAVT